MVRCQWLDIMENFSHRNVGGNQGWWRVLQRSILIQTLGGIRQYGSEVRAGLLLAYTLLR